MRAVRPRVALLLRSVRPCLPLLVVSAFGWACPTALAAWAGPDPSSNYAADPSCSGSQCLADAVRILDEARANLGQPPYSLPTNFDQLSAVDQAFVLTNLDRKLYGLPLITGVTDELNAAAAAGVQSANDPSTGDPSIRAYTSNWGEGYEDMALAYEDWMYDDGPGSANLDCSSLTPSGCWSHRHSVLWEFGSGPLAMGAADGTGPDGLPSDTLILAEGGSGYHPNYTYTWSEAVAAGAGSGNGGSSASGASTAPASTAPSPTRSLAGSVTSPTPQLRIMALRVRRHSISFQVAAPGGVSLACALTRLRSRYSGFRRCSQYTTYVGVARGRYRLRVRGAGQTASRYVVVR